MENELKCYVAKLRVFSLIFSVLLEVDLMQLGNRLKLLERIRGLLDMVYWFGFCWVVDVG